MSDPQALSPEPGLRGSTATVLNPGARQELGARQPGLRAGASARIIPVTLPVSSTRQAQILFTFSR